MLYMQFLLYSCVKIFGHWEEDDADDLLRCTNEKCGVCNHTNCLKEVMICMFVSYVHISNMFLQCKLFTIIYIAM